MKSECTLIVIKPDGIRRHLIGKIISRFEDKGFRVNNLRFFIFFLVNRPLNFIRYTKRNLSSKNWFHSLLGPVIACLIEGNNAITAVRLMAGATKSFEAAPGTIRGDFGLSLTENLIHASDSPESFIKESGVIFNRT